MNQIPRLRRPSPPRTPCTWATTWGPCADSVDMQDDNDCVFWWSLHSITTGQDPATMSERTRSRPRGDCRGHRPGALHAADPVPGPEHTQLAWVLNCITGYGGRRRWPSSRTSP
ncbi:hypothetical protein QJS66_08740 [Kocuria rhizophila]|nr:hypothetical protein QJS66_08740 [Kocuria rhizophila]